MRAVALVLLLVAGVGAQTTFRWVERSHWWLDTHPVRLRVGSAKATLVLLGLPRLVWSLGAHDITAHGTAAGIECRVRALPTEDLLVFDVRSRDPLLLRVKLPGVSSGGPDLANALFGGRQMALLAVGGGLVVGADACRIQLPAGGGTLVFCLGRAARDSQQVAALRLGARHRLELASVQDAAWLRQGLLLHSPSAPINKMFRRALLQLRAQIAPNGRVFDAKRGAGFGVAIRPTVSSAAALWVSGHRALARRIVAALRDETMPQLLAAHTRQLRRFGWLPAAPPFKDDPVIGDLAGLPLHEWLTTRQGLGHLPEAPEAWVHAGTGRLCFLPGQPRPTAWHLVIGTAWLPLPVEWRVAAARTWPDALRELLQPDGTFALMGRFGTDRASPPSPLATCLLAEWRLARGDRDGAERALRAVAVRTSGWLAHSWRRADDQSAAAAARFVLTAIGLTLRSGAGAWQVGLPESWDRVTLAGYPLGEARAEVTLERERGSLRMCVRGGRRLPAFRCVASGGAVDVPQGGTAVAGVSVGERLLTLPERLPDTVRCYTKAGEEYRVQLAETLAMIRRLRRKQTAPRVVRVRKSLSPQEEARAIDSLRGLSRFIERQFEARNRK